MTDPDDFDDREFHRRLREEVPYLDEDWLGDLRFRMRMTADDGGGLVSGIYTITGLLGAGSNNVVFRTTSPDGLDAALRLPRRILSVPSYIRELPPHMNLGVQFDAARLERKLDRLAGVAALDTVVDAYRSLYMLIIENLHAWPSFQDITWEERSIEAAVKLGVKMPGTQAELVRLASSSHAVTREWATATRESIDNVTVDSGTEDLHANPLYIWGGAVLEGYFADDPGVAVVQAFRRLYADPDHIDLFMAQGWAIAYLLELFDITDQYRSFWDGVNGVMNLRPRRLTGSADG
jgi:hypothetical protein